MYKGFFALGFEFLLFWFVSSNVEPAISNQRDKEMEEKILNSFTEKKCEVGLYDFLASCDSIKNPIIKNVGIIEKNSEQSLISGEIDFVYKESDYYCTFYAYGQSVTNNSDTVISVFFDKLLICDHKHHLRYCISDKGKIEILQE